MSQEWIKALEAEQPERERGRRNSWGRAGEGVVWETTTREPTKSEAEEVELRDGERETARRLIREGESPEAVGRIIIAARRRNLTARPSG